MGTIVQGLQQQKITKEWLGIARKENIDVHELLEDIGTGRIVVLRNNRHRISPVAIGKGMRVKINANVGTSPGHCDPAAEIQKVEAALHAGADTVMDLSIAGNVSDLRRRILDAFDVPLGTVPIYEAVIGLKTSDHLDVDRFLRVMSDQAEEGVDFMTIHAGLLKRHLPLLERRVTGIVSRGGAIIAQWMRHHNRENFLYECFDDILKIAKAHGITLSLGDGLRPGSTADANDQAQFGELEVIGELVIRCRKAGVQVMVEGPGHVPMNLIEKNIRLQKQCCDEAPFYVLGPLVIDRAPGWDHITGAIGAAMAGMYGADFLCVVTPAEHLRLPGVEDVCEGVKAFRIAAAAADLARQRSSEIEANRTMSQARKNFDWIRQREISLDPEKFDRYLERVTEGCDPTDNRYPCTMCGEWCAMKRSPASSTKEGTMP